MICPRCKEQLRFSRAPLPPGLQCLACGQPPGASSPKHFQCALCERVVFCAYCRVCPDGHHVKRVGALIERGGKRYDKTYVCDICSSNCSTVPPEGIFHCTACTWDCCEDCEARLRR